MHNEKYNVIFCSEAGQHHVEAKSQKEIIEVLKTESEKLIKKIPWTQILIIEHTHRMTILPRGFGYGDYRPLMMTLEKFLCSNKWKEIALKYMY